MAFCAEWSRSQRGRANEGQGSEKIIPGGEHKKGGDDPQRLEETLARHQFAHGRAPFGGKLKIRVKSGHKPKPWLSGNVDFCGHRRHVSYTIENTLFSIGRRRVHFWTPWT